MALALDRCRGSGLPPPPAYIEGAEGYEVDQPLQAYVMQVALAFVAVLEESDATTLPAQPSLAAAGPSRPRPSDRLDEHASGPADVWLDMPVLYYIRTGLHHADTSTNPEERARVLKRAAFYSWAPAEEAAPRGSPLAQAHLLRKMADSYTNTCPLPSARPTTISETHAACGHFGCRRTESLLLTSNWWTRMRQDVDQVLS